GVYFSNNSGGAWTTATIPYFLPVVSVRSIDYRFSQFTSYLSITTFGRGAWSITPPLTPSRAP
ncbi:MAG TPA: hypothetical protein VKT78_20605, partial [Fimbriimonadaceae bacterium]|nr:hypothetical protein [Fimbriimonadaceae bacterium]